MVYWESIVCNFVYIDASKRWMQIMCFHTSVFNSLRPRWNRCHFADDIFKCIFLNENECISLRISLKFVPKVRINTIPSLVQIMAWRRPGDEPLSEPMAVSLLTHICITRPQWVKWYYCCIWPVSYKHLQKNWQPYFGQSQYSRLVHYIM